MIQLSQREPKRFIIIPDAQPDWGPLESVFTDESVLDNFMFMGSVRLHTGTSINLYKNSISRKYINLDSAGNAYSYSGDDYKQVPLSVAKDTVLG